MIKVGETIINEDVENILTELKRQLEINGVKRFAKFIRTNNNIQTNCPFHKDGQEKKPSFGVSTIDGMCHCFGCGWKGTLPEMISNVFGRDDYGLFGGQWLVRNFVSIEVENRPELDLNFSRNKTITQQEFVSEATLSKYRVYHSYMYKRKLTNPIIELFDIGYNEETQCITFPVRDIDGNCLFVAERSVNTKFFHYPNGVEKPVYGLYEIARVKQQMFKNLLSMSGVANLNFGEEIIICESMIDALTCWVYGKPAVALNGLGNALQMKQLREMPTRKFILATDMDEAGLKAREFIRAALKNKIVTEYRWDVKIAKDINDMSSEYFNSLQDNFW